VPGTRVSAGVEVSPELRIAVSPERTYRDLVREAAENDLLTVLRRPALVALITGTALAMAATGVLPGRLLLSTVICWSFAPLVQVIAAAAVIASVPRREIAMGRALDLLFAGHAPWSLWLLSFGAAAAWGPGDVVSAAALWTLPLPILWTAWILRAFFRSVLNTTPRGALVRTALHQGIIWTIGGAYVITAISWPRLIPMLEGLQR
jgi:hypothetical protein